MNYDWFRLAMQWCNVHLYDAQCRPQIALYAAGLLSSTHMEQQKPPRIAQQFTIARKMCASLRVSSLSLFILQNSALGQGYTLNPGMTFFTAINPGAE